MKKYALAALLALPIFGFTTMEAVAGGYFGGYSNNHCCGKPSQWTMERKYYVPRPSIVYERDNRDAYTSIHLKPGIYVFAKCRNGWCQIEPKLYESAWVLAECLEPAEEQYRDHGEFRPRPRTEFDEQPYRPRYQPRRFDPDE